MLKLGRGQRKTTTTAISQQARKNTKSYKRNDLCPPSESPVFRSYQNQCLKGNVSGYFFKIVNSFPEIHLMHRNDRWSDIFVSSSPLSAHSGLARLHLLRKEQPHNSPMGVGTMPGMEPSFFPGFVFPGTGIHSMSPLV